VNNTANTFRISQGKVNELAREEGYLQAVVDEEFHQDFTQKYRVPFARTSEFKKNSFWYILYEIINELF